MIEQYATVVRLEGDRAWITAERESSCGQCSLRKGCGTAVLANVLGRRSVNLWALNPLQAQPGERVVVGLDESAMLRGAMAVYLVPLLALILGAGLLAGQGDTAAIAGGVVGFLAGLFWLRRFHQRIQYDPRFQPVILRRLQPGGIAVQLFSR